MFDSTFEAQGTYTCLPAERTAFRDLPPNTLEHIARCLGARYEVPSARKWRNCGTWGPLQAFAATSTACFAAVAASGQEVVLTDGSSLSALQRHARLRQSLRHTRKLTIRTQVAMELKVQQWEELAEIVEAAGPCFRALYISSWRRSGVPFDALGRLVAASRCVACFRSTLWRCGRSHAARRALAIADVAVHTRAGGRGAQLWLAEPCTVPTLA